MSAQAVNSPRPAREASLPTPANKTRLPASATHSRAILEPLATEFNHGGFHYKQVAREGRVAIYSQAWSEIKNPSVAYEVVRIKALPDRMMFGKLVPAHEAYPGSEEWGERGWTYTDLDRAFARFRKLAKKGS
jgi:hypothetical protein